MRRLIIPLTATGALLLAGTADSAVPTAPAAKGDPLCKPGPRLLPPPSPAPGEPGRPPRVFSQTEPTQRNENRTKRRAVFTFSSKRSVTKEAQITAGAEASVNALFASASAYVDVTLAKSTTTEIESTATIPTPRNRAAIGRYGVYYYFFSGQIFSRKGTGMPASPGCKYKMEKIFTAKFPASEAGWVLTTEKL